MRFHGFYRHSLSYNLELQTELRQFCLSLFGQEKFDGVPDPSVDWEGFVSDIGRFNSQESKIYDPIKKKILPWVDIRELNRLYGKKNGDCVCSVM